MNRGDPGLQMGRREMDDEKVVNNVIKMELDLDRIWVDDDGWNSTLASIVKEELRTVIKTEIRKALRESTDLKKAIKALHKKAAQQILDELK